jgi:hypothetical protein
MTDLDYILASLKDPTGKILIEGIMDDVLPVMPEEQALYRDIDFDVVSSKVITALLQVSTLLFLSF